MEMAKPFQEGGTEIYNQWITNMLLANSRLWAARDGVIAATEDIYPGKVMPLPNPREDLIGLQMADTYESAPQALAVTMQFIERRIGTNAASGGRPQASFGSRTPGITALSMLQQVTRRFTPAFDAMRGALSRSIVQCIWRYRERVLADDKQVITKLAKILGPDDGALVVQVLRQDDFQSAVEIELTASSASVNRDQDRQSMIILGTQVLGPYYQRVIELAMLASNPQLPPEVREVIGKVARATADGIDQIVRTFDQVRDPQLLAVSIISDLEAMQQNLAQQQQIMQLMQMLGGQPPGGGPPNAQGAPAPAAPQG
jgi:hypothetical protein